MQTDNRLLDDLARVATGALGTLQGARSEVRARLRDQFERVLGDLDLVTREEFDAVKAMAAAARAENEALAARVAALEGKRGGAKSTRARATAAPKGSAKAAPKGGAKAKRAGAAKTTAAAASKATARPARRTAAKGKAKAGAAPRRGRKS